MSGYLTSLIALVTIISLVIIILPNGTMKRVSCVALSIIISFTLLLPIINFVTDKNLTDYNIQSGFDDETYYQEELYNFLIKKSLKEDEIDIVSVKCELENNVIKKIGIKLDKIGITTQDEHTLIIVKVKEILFKKFNVQKENIYFYE